VVAIFVLGRMRTARFEFDRRENHERLCGMLVRMSKPEGFTKGGVHDGAYELIRPKGESRGVVRHAMRVRVIRSAPLKP